MGINFLNSPDKINPLIVSAGEDPLLFAEV
jgi:hypothetical protein